MYETEELKRKKEEKEKQMKENQIKKYSKEIQQIEELTKLEMNYILFDSDNDRWKIFNSEFGDKLKGHKNIVIVIEDEENNIFGGYINAY